MVTELPPFRQQLLDVIDLSICEDVVAPLSLPGFDNSAMDGYAVQAADVERASDDDPVVPAGRRRDRGRPGALRTGWLRARR